MRYALRLWIGALVTLFPWSAMLAQQLKLGNNPPIILKSAVLELNSTNQGLLFTRIADTNLINTMNPPDGMVIYCTPAKQLMVRANGYWQGLATGTLTGANYWSVNGNTNGSIKKFGNTDNFDLPFITNNVERMRISNSGNVAIGASSFDATNPEKLLIDAGVTNSVNALYAKGTTNKYFQINIQNLSNGSQASSDLVATANNGTESTNFVNVGINGSNFVYQAGNPIETGKANDCYLIGSGNDLYLVNNNAAKDMIFLVGGTATTNEAMRITPNENIGIATVTPAAKLDVAGNYKLGAKGTVNKNQTNFPVVISSSVPGASLNVLFSTFTPGVQDITITIPTANQPTTAQATVNVSPALDLPASVSIAFARMVNVSTIKVRLLNQSTNGPATYSGTMYVTINEF